MTESEVAEALEKVCKWRAVFTGRILGTRLMKYGRVVEGRR
jgi:hypothetical protein